MKNDTLVDWLKYVIDASRLHTRAEWADVIGVSPQAQGRWLAEKDVPRPETLRRLVIALEDDGSEPARLARRRWEALATRPLAEVVPGTRHDFPTLAHMLVEPQRVAFERTLKTLPPSTQETVLRAGLKQANQYILQRDRSSSQVARVAEPSAALEQLAPLTIKAHGRQQIVNVEKQVQRRKSYWLFATT